MRRGVEILMMFIFGEMLGKLLLFLEILVFSFASLTTTSKFHGGNFVEKAHKDL